MLGFSFDNLPLAIAVGVLGGVLFFVCMLFWQHGRRDKAKQRSRKNNKQTMKASARQPQLDAAYDVMAQHHNASVNFSHAQAAAGVNGSVPQFLGGDPLTLYTPADGNGADPDAIPGFLVPKEAQQPAQPAIKIIDPGQYAWKQHK